MDSLKGIGVRHTEVKESQGTGVCVCVRVCVCCVCARTSHPEV